MPQGKGTYGSKRGRPPTKRKMKKKGKCQWVRVCNRRRAIIKSSTRKTTIEFLERRKMGKLCARGKAAAKRKYDVYPSAYANSYAVRVCKGQVKGPDGKKKTASGYKRKKV